MFQGILSPSVIYYQSALNSTGAAGGTMNSTGSTGG